MLRDPIARVAETVGELRKIERVAQRICTGSAGHDWREIENGKRDRHGLRSRQNQWRSRQSFFQPVSRLLRNCIAIP
jgi:hypothetical protein